MIQSALGKLSQNDVIKSALTAVVASVVVALGAIVTQPNFDIATVDWGATLHLIINVSISAFVGDIVRRLSTDQNGKLFGKIG